jgi:predicted dehydrogenase
MDRRAFLQTTIAAAAAAAGPIVAAKPQRTGPIGANDRIRLGVIGCGGRSGQDLTSFAQAPNNVFVAACDVFKERLDAMVERLSKESGQKVDSYGDYRRVLDRKDIDALLVGTPDHWHPQMVIDACTAGKDVYCEKPVGNSIEPSVKMVQAVRKYNRVVQVGTQQRSWGHFQEAAKLIDQLGGVTHVVLQFGGGGSPTTDPVVPVPQGLDWDGFQGPAPRKPYKTSRQRNWRYYYDYGGGLVTDWGVHLVDVVNWYMGTDGKAPNLTTAVAQYVNVENPDPDRPPNAYLITWQYDKFLMSWGNMVMGNTDFPFHGNVFYGPRGSLLVNRTGYMLRPPEGRGGGGGRARAGAAAPGGGQGAGTRAGGPPQGYTPQPPPPPPVEAKTVPVGVELEAIVVATTAHAANFLDCVRSRKKPICDIEVGFYSTLPCLLGLLAIRERRPYTWDAANMRAKPV